MEAVLLDQLVGQQVGDCQLERLLSHGQMYAIYRARQLPSNRPVTLTLLMLPEGMPAQVRQQFQATFLREVPALVEMTHDHLIPLFGYGEWEGWPYLVMPFLPAESLATILGRQRSYTPAMALTVLEQVSAGLEYAHSRGIVHGALTPFHLLVSRDQRIGIAGIGLLHLLARYNMLPLTVSCERILTLAGPWSVNPRYLAPECIDGRVADVRSDIYSLALVLFDLLAGASPGVGMPSAREHEQLLLPRAFADVLQRALAADPGERFQCVSDFSAAFADAGNQQASSPHPALGNARREDNTHLASRFPLREIALTQANMEVALPASRSEQRQPGRPISRRRHGRNEGGIHAPGMRHMSRRRMLSKLARGATLGVLGVSGVSSAYLLTTALLKLPSSQTANKGPLPPDLNKAQVFTNPGNGREGVLVRLPNGTLVAYDRACTHVGVYVDYDSTTHMLVCPAHQALFDPAHGGRVVSGPAPRPLPKVTIHKNSDGTLLLGESEEAFPPTLEE
jgi:serine/threonine protein kinase/nitrite reductase/ring-hydroxylating ferredoxin subunit